MYASIENVITESGLWDGERRLTHAFPISADVFELTGAQYAQLTALGPVLRDTLAGASRILAIAQNPDLSNSHAWRELRRVCQMEAPSPQGALQALYPRKIPQIIKVDLVEDENGMLKLVEIDAMNRRAMGYACLLASIRDLVAPGAAKPPGIVQAFRTYARSGASLSNHTMVLLYGDRERFYAPEFEILRRHLAAAKFPLVVTSELDACWKNGEFCVRGQVVHSPVFVNFPVFYKNKELEKVFVERYREDASAGLRCLIPPKPFLGSKALLAILSNARRDNELEAILRSQISASVQVAMLKVLPKSLLVGREGVAMAEPFLLKEVISSGAKGIHFPDDPGFEAALCAAGKSPGRFIAQEIVPLRRRDVRYFRSPHDEVSEARYTRLVAYYFQGALAEVVVTACSGRLVHGGKEAVNMGVVIK